MVRKHHVIYIPGLSDHRKSYELIINRWSLYGVIPHVYRVGWHDGESFKPKLKRLIDYINCLQDKGGIVSLVGASAGGSVALNALVEQHKINAVVNLCGRLQAGKNVSPALKVASKNSISFRESVIFFESREPRMTKHLRQKVLTLTPIWDEIVPKPTVFLKGATNKTLPSVEHMLSGFLGMTIFSSMIVKFLKDKVIKYDHVKSS